VKRCLIAAVGDDPNGAMVNPDIRWAASPINGAGLVDAARRACCDLARDRAHGSLAHG
jgi:hypothetical protein